MLNNRLNDKIREILDLDGHPCDSYLPKMWLIKWV